MTRIRRYFDEVWSELRKVSWPTRTELIRSVIVVIISLILLTAVLFAFDIFWHWVLSILRVQK